MSRDTDPADGRDATGGTGGAGHVPGQPTEKGADRLKHFAASLGDSAGQPWQGREFDDNPFGDDDGTAPPALLGALAAFRAGEVGPEAVVDALRASRLLIPLVAELGDEGTTDAGLTVDKSQELSIVTVSGPDGRSVLPVFSSVTAMQTWNPAARPVPADGRRVALAAASEETEIVVLDPTSETEFVLRRPAVWRSRAGSVGCRATGTPRCSPLSTRRSPPNSECTPCASPRATPGTGSRARSSSCSSRSPAD